MSAACRLRNAYIQIAILGTSFCTSAKKVGNSALYVYNEVLFAFKQAFFLILNNALRFGAVALLGMVINVIGHRACALR